MYCTKPRKLRGYCHSIEHLIEYCIDLLAKIKEKRGPNIHMVTTEPRDKLNDPVNVRVITRGGVHIGRDVARETM